MQTIVKGNGSRAGNGRFASPAQDRAEQVIDFQVALEDIEREHEAEAAATAREIAEDGVDDRRRFLKYRAVEHAIRHGDRELQLAAFHSLVAHIEADELREDARRVGRKAALERLQGRLVELRKIFRADFVPLILQELGR